MNRTPARLLVTHQQYTRIHNWLRSVVGPATRCSNSACPKKVTRFEWALKRGKQYDYSIKNFKQLCKTCHFKYDYPELYREHFKQCGHRLADHHVKTIREVKQKAGLISDGAALRYIIDAFKI